MRGLRTADDEQARHGAPGPPPLRDVETPALHGRGRLLLCDRKALLEPRVDGAAAIRVAAETITDPCIIPMLFHGARFIHTSRALDAAPEERISCAPTTAGDLEAVLLAIAEQRSQDAVGMAAAWIAQGTDLQPLEHALMDLVIRDPLTRPIVVAHAIKNTVIGFEEYRACSDPAPVLAAVRLLSSPIQERRIHRVTREAIGFVTEGKVPRVLA